MEKLAGSKLGGAGYAAYAEKPQTMLGGEKEKVTYTKFIGDGKKL